MTDEQKTLLEEELRHIRSTVPQFLVKLGTSTAFTDVRNRIYDYTSFMDGHGFDYDMMTRVYFILNGIRQFPKCQNPNCNNDVIHFRNITNIDYEYAYPMFCSQDCRYHRDVKRERERQNMDFIESLNKKSDAECLHDLKKFVSIHPLYPQRFLKPTPYNNYLLEYVYRKTKLLDDAKFVPTLSTRLYWAVNELTDYPKCRCCGKPLDKCNVHSLSSGYPIFCSLKCENSADEETKKEFYWSFDDEDMLKLASKDESELVDELKTCIEENREYVKVIMRPGGKWHYLYKFIMDSTRFLDDFYTFKTRVFFILRGWKEERRCAECGKVIRKNMRSIYEKFPDFCSIKCSRPTIYAKSMVTLKKKYGIDCKCVFNIPNILEKSLTTRKKNFEERKRIEYEQQQSTLYPYQRDTANYWSLDDEQKRMFVDELRELTIEHSQGYARTIMADGGKKHYLYRLVEQATSPLLSDPFYKFHTKVWFVLNGVRRFPRCLTCGKRLDHRNLHLWSREYPRFCCPSCGTLHESTQSKMKSACMEMYGVKNPMQSEEIKQIVRNTMIERYGTYSTLDIPGMRERIKETTMRKYGVEFAMQNEDIKRKYRETNLRKYGYENGRLNPEINARAIKTMVERYGCDNPQKCPEIRQRTMMTNMERYGATNPMKNHDIFKKVLASYCYDGKQFDSSWELAYYIWLRDNNIEFEYQPNIYFEYTACGSTHRYFPDFKIGDDVIEIKGEQFFDDNGRMINPYDKSKNHIAKSKFECMRENNVMIMRKVEIKPYLDYVYNKYGRKYLKTFKRS